MSLFYYLVLLFVGIPLLELALLLWIGQHVGVLATIGLIVVTGVIGAALARQQGLSTLARFQSSLRENRLPHRELVEGILILLAAAVLLTPGLLTDTAGFLILVPPVRRWVRRFITRRIERRFVLAVPGQPRPRTDHLDVEFTVDDRPPPGEGQP